MKKSRVYKFKNKLFRYDYDDCVVEYIYKATEEEYEDNKKWMAKYGKPMHYIDKNGYIEIEAVGLRKENWTNKAVRDEYLEEWIEEMMEAVAYEMSFEEFL